MSFENNRQVILVTGGTGFAGSHLAELLLQHQSGEIHITQFSSKDSVDIPGFEHFKLHQVDLTNSDATVQLIQEVQPTQIYHLASFAYVGKSFEKGSSLLINNILLQHNLLEAVAHHAPQARVLVIGSAEEYGLSNKSEIPITEDHPFRPVNPYAVSKIAQDMLGFAYAQSYKLDIVRVRPFNHIGERQTGDFAVSAFAKQIVAIERGQQDVLLVGNLEGVRDFTDVKDMVAAYKILMEKGERGDVYNVGSGVGIKMKTILDQLVSFALVPIQIAVDESRFRPLDITTIVANNDKITELGWQTTIPLQNSLQRVLDYWRSIL